MRRAFTLVEILIVVIILGILAAIVIPQFTNASTDARKVNMTSQLQSLRTMVQLYRVHHRDNPPLLVSGAGWPLLTSKTLSDGTVDSAGMFGPYLPSPPINPLTGSSDVVAAGSAPATTPGWYYEESTGEIHGANSQGDQSDTGL
jgi:general secretion pathway protein G